MAEATCESSPWAVSLSWEGDGRCYSCDPCVLMAKYIAEIQHPTSKLKALVITQVKSHAVFHLADFLLLQVLRDDLTCWDTSFSTLAPQIFTEQH